MTDQDRTYRVSDIMRTEVVTAAPNDSVGRVARLMVEQGLPGIPVVDDGEIIGIISEGDLVERDAEVTVPSFFAFFDADFKPLGHLIERPASVTELMAQKRKEIFARHPEWGSPDQSPAEMSEEVRGGYMQEYGLARAEARSFSDSEVQREFRELVERAAQ